MRLEKASAKAVKYACMNFHYAKMIPSGGIGANGYSVFNDKNEWCGVVLFSYGSRNGGKPYNLVCGQFSELIRVALNGKQKSTSQAVARAIKIFGKENPLCKLLVSYADTGQDHKGTIYQAMNWFYEGEIEPTRPLFKDKFGKMIHSRTAANMKKRGVIQHYDDGLQRIQNTNKHRYIYPLCKSMLPLCKQLAKPYPKKALEVHAVEHLATSQEVGGSSPTPALQNSNKTETNGI